MTGADEGVGERLAINLTVNGAKVGQDAHVCLPPLGTPPPPPPLLLPPPGRRLAFRHGAAVAVAVAVAVAAAAAASADALLVGVNIGVDCLLRMLCQWVCFCVESLLCRIIGERS